MTTVQRDIRHMLTGSPAGARMSRPTASAS
jgi:hypothetical protein